MKKNDMTTFLVYVLMLGLAVLVGLAWVRPLLVDYGAHLALPGVVIVILTMVASIILNASILELGHLLGAKTGKYRVRSFVILGFGFKIKNGQKKVGFHSFGGLAGETRVAPMDAEKSRLTGYIGFPLLFLLIEVVLCAVMIGLGNAFVKGANADKSMAWLSVVGVTDLGIAGMLILYNYFPARLDEPTDGYLMIATSRNINKIAYNHLLLKEEAEALGQPAPKDIVYDEVTDFTYVLNLQSFYKEIENKNKKAALMILDKAIATEKGLSKGLINQAKCLKLAALLEDFGNPEGKRTYEELDDSTKTHISAMSDMASVRCYILISAFIENAEGECNYAIEKAGKALKGELDFAKETERRLAEEDVENVRKMHPGWTVSELPWKEIEDEDENENEEENKENKDEE